MSVPAFAGLRFGEELLTRPPVGGIDVEATLEHFAIITYAVPVARVQPHIHPRYELDSYPGLDGEPLVWVSVVPFEDQDFHFVRAPGLRFRFGQTNYRTYVRDRANGERAVWFFGASLDSWSVLIPRHLWQLPWHHGRIRFDCAYDHAAGRYSRYRMMTTSDWAPVGLELTDTGLLVAALDGFAEAEAALVALTHPLTGVFYRRDGALGSYRIWHDRLACTAGRVVTARFGLLDRLGLVPYAVQAAPHSVLIQRRTAFTIYLPPQRLRPLPSRTLVP